MGRGNGAFSVNLKSYSEVVEELLKLGANPNTPYSDVSPLTWCNDAATFDTLLKYGANPNKLVDGYPASWVIFNEKFSGMSRDILYCIA